jgi:hypothetical protein|tara:strand:+ start:652 stop:990 length:339 start_codon:yes stop_codon:yes gene_type:complete
MLPPAPDAAVPVAIDAEPDAPAVETPLATLTAPLTPEVPAFADEIVSTPLEVALPSPVVMAIVPPVTSLLEPELSVRLPPIPESPLPTAIEIAPPVPVTAAPVLIETSPDEP